jgi:hypothetical protein
MKRLGLSYGFDILSFGINIFFFKLITHLNLTTDHFFLNCTLVKLITANFFFNLYTDHYFKTPVSSFSVQILSQYDDIEAAQWKRTKTPDNFLLSR